MLLGFRFAGLRVTTSKESFENFIVVCLPYRRMKIVMNNEKSIVTLLENGSLDMSQPVDQFGLSFWNRGIRAAVDQSAVCSVTFPFTLMLLSCSA
ncbi:hypothetical protein T4D_3396 [Trichinella pseudospiralis]|uniref:Uncharacterized protein n=1 Tax=Trichinella pseudospiralis TaxID=6337 RepID=A0A0V1FUT3_TRIPS|nr:hypothetical protein T4D_3396 [Trichinella pseudospiralis]